MEIKEINQLLAQDPLSVCKLLFPQGEVMGQEYCVGSINGEKGGSLRVHLGTDKAGLWTDFAGGDKGGDLIDLWMKSRHITKKEAITQIQEYLNIVETEKSDSIVFPKPVYRDSPVREGSPVMSYLTEVRGLFKETLQKYKIEESKGKGFDWVLFPSYRHDELVLYKGLPIQRQPDGSKFPPYRDPKGDEAIRCLFGWQSLTGDERSITIDEGEINAMTLSQWGFPALAVPIGAGNGNKHRWIETEWAELELFDIIYIRADNDEPGQQMVLDLVQRLGHHRCKVLKFPFDPNECLLKGYTKQQIAQIYAEAEFLHPTEVNTFHNLKDRIYKRFYKDPHVKSGFVPRFRVLQPDGYMKYPKLEFRYGESTVLAGFSHEGKSQIAKQLLLDAILQGERVCYADLENPEDSTGHRFVRSALAEPWPTKPQIESCVIWLNSNVFLVGRNEGIHLEKIHELFLYLRRKFGVTIFVLDSLMMVEGVKEDDNDSQKEAMRAILNFDRQNGTHTILIAHFKKPQYNGGYVDFHNPPNRFQISGTAHLVNMADNVILFFRNRQKEDILNEKTSLPDGRSLETIAGECDALFSIDKQRNDESWTGAVKLWWLQEPMQYIEKRNDLPFRYFK